MGTPSGKDRSKPHNRALAAGHNPWPPAAPTHDILCDIGFPRTAGTPARVEGFSSAVEVERGGGPPRSTYRTTPALAQWERRNTACGTTPNATTATPAKARLSTPPGAELISPAVDGDESSHIVRATAQ